MTDTSHNLPSWRALLDSLPAGATISRSMLERALATDEGDGQVNLQEVVNALVGAIVSIELTVKGLDIKK